MSLGRIIYLTFFGVTTICMCILIAQLGNKVYAITDATNVWQATTSLPLKVASTSVSSFNGKLYIFGGANTIDYSAIYTSSFSANGSIAAWSSANNILPQTRYWAAAAQKGSRIYILGGSSLNIPGNFTDIVSYSMIQDDGEVSSWQTLDSIPQKLGMGAAAIIGDRIYFAGGFNNGGASNKVYSAVINSDGTLGKWSTAGNMPEARYGLSMLSYNGHLIILGGYNGGYLSTVYKTTPASDGTVSSWQATTEFPFPIYRTAATIVGSQIITVGGALALQCPSCGAFSSTRVYYADLAIDGSVGEWKLSDNRLPSEVHGASVAQVGDYLYLMGGYNSGNNHYLDSVYFTKLNLEATLNVPLLKQTDPLWSSQTYDSSAINIATWGCALTSAAMVFQHHHITKLPDGTVLNPGTLNTWLKSRPRGYIGASVNWIELAVLSKLAKSRNPSFSFDALEFKKTYSYNPGQLKQDLKDNIPGILEVDNHQHFLVATGTSGNTFLINDPYYDVTKLDQVHGNAFSSLGRFIPSNTDLSYMEIVIDDGVSIIVKDANGNVVGQGFTDQPSSPDGTRKGSKLNFYYVPQPSNGDYTVILSSPTTKSYKLQSLLYDINGNLAFKDINGVMGSSSEDTFSITFNSNRNQATNISQNYSFDSLVSDLELLYSQKLITNLGVYMAMREDALQAKKLAPKSKVSAKAIMGSLLTILESNHKKTVKDAAYQILKPEIVFLQISLK